MHMVSGHPISGMEIFQSRENSRYMVSHFKLLTCREEVFASHFPLMQDQGRDFPSGEQSISAHPGCIQWCCWKALYDGEEGRRNQRMNLMRWWGDQLLERKEDHSSNDVSASGTMVCVGIDMVIHTLSS